MPPGPLRILIADDHSVVRHGLRSLLESQPGWEVCAEAANGREAVELAKRLNPNIVILDITMPELNGLEATRQIVKSVPQVEVLILTMHTSEEVARQVLRAGARGFLLKSDTDRELIGAVETLQRHKPFLSPHATEFILDSFVSGSKTNETECDLDPTTPREREIIQLLAEGKTNKEVATALGVSVRTVEGHRARIMEKLNLHSTSELVRYAIRNHIIQP